MQISSFSFQFLSSCSELSTGNCIGTGKLGQLVAQLLQCFATSHHAGQFLAADLGFGEGAVATPTVEDGEVVTNGIGVMGVVCDKDHAQSPHTRLSDIAQDDASLF